jgi:hypothetical protein
MANQPLTGYPRNARGVNTITFPAQKMNLGDWFVKKLFLTAMGLFIGQSPAFFQLMTDLAEDADEARRGRGQKGRSLNWI